MKEQKRAVVFLIDDDEDDKEIFGLALEDIDPGIKYVTAGNGREAMKMLEDDAGFLPDLIFLDLNMPKMDGRQCLAEIKKLPRLEQIPVIIYSTSADDREIGSLLAAGASAWLSKPTDLRVLVSQLSGYLAPFIENKTTLN
jgi:CheY-like chemotaxis protein